MNTSIRHELGICANNPLSLHDIELIELEAIDVLMQEDPGTRRDHAKRVLAMTAEIRKARGQWETQAMTSHEIDEEIDALHGQPTTT